MGVLATSILFLAGAFGLYLFIQKLTGQSQSPPSLTLSPPTVEKPKDDLPKISAPGITTSKHDEPPSIQMPPPEKPSLAKPSLNVPSSMAPPARARQRKPPNMETALRAETMTTPALLRLPTTVTQKAAKPSKQVALAPGHSPLDWAILQRSGQNLRGIPQGTFLRVSKEELQAHNKRNDAWTVLGGRVYNITPYLPFHPGGQGELMRAAGRDGTKLFQEFHPWINWDNMLTECIVGIYVGGE